MNIMIATDGTMEPERAAAATERLYRDGDKVFVFTALDVPADFLRGLSRSGVRAAAEIAHEAGHPMSSGDRVAERLAPIRQIKPTARDEGSPVLTAMADSARSRTQPIVESLEGRGITSEAVWRTTENQAAKAIIQTAATHDCDLVIIGSLGRGRFEGRLGSTGTKVVRRSPTDVFIIRSDHPE